MEANDFAAVVADTLREVFRDDPPDFVARIPHGHCDCSVIEADLRAGGFTDVEIDRVVLGGTCPSAADLAVGFCLDTPRLAAYVVSAAPTGRPGTSGDPSRDANRR